jgi:hypothetical protein
MDQVGRRLAELAPHGTRPFRVHIDPADDGAAVVNAVADRIRVEFLTRIGLEDVLHPQTARSSLSAGGSRAARDVLDRRPEESALGTGTPPLSAPALMNSKLT